MMNVQIQLAIYRMYLEGMRGPMARAFLFAKSSQVHVIHEYEVRAW